MSGKTSKKGLENTELQSTDNALIGDIQPIDTVNSNNNSELAGMIRAEINQMETFSGPLPRPQDLQSYEDVMPGAANRIFEMAEREAAHRHSANNAMLKTEARDSLLGIISAFILCSGTILAGVSIALGVPSTAGTVVGGLLGASGLASVFGVMIKSTRTSWQIGPTNTLPGPQEEQEKKQP